MTAEERAREIVQEWAEDAEPFLLVRPIKLVADAIRAAEREAGQAALETAAAVADQRIAICERACKTARLHEDALSCDAALGEASGIAARIRALKGATS